MDFVALDWETANGARGSACAVGLADVRGGQLVETWSSLIRPRDGFAGFDPRNIAVHGLTEQDVADAPCFAEVWPAVLERLDGRVVVAHNATFDLGVIQDATWAAGVSCPRLRHGCTLLLARRHYDLPTYTLDVVAEAAGVPFDRHHDAHADAVACAEVLLRISEDAAAASVADAFEIHGLALGWSAGPDAQPCRVVGRSRWDKLGPGEERATAPTLW